MDDNENTKQKLNACMNILDIIMEYHNVMDGGAFEHIGSSIERCHFCKIPFFIDDETNHGDEHKEYCHENRCQKYWCRRSEYCVNELVKCVFCNDYICLSHSYPDSNNTDSSIDIFCRTCIKTKRVKKIKIVESL